MNSPGESENIGAIEVATESESENHPLRRIAQPDETNDAIVQTTSDLHLEDSPVLSELFGDRRLRSLVEQYAGEYKEKSRLEKSMVAAEILRIWRSQTPPGRFLKFDANANLWHDVGNNKALEQISGMLRECDGWAEDDLTARNSEHQDVVASSVKPLQGKPVRSITEVLNRPGEPVLYGRDTEQRKLVAIFHRQIENRNEGGPAEMCLICGESGSGKTSLVRSFVASQKTALLVEGKFVTLHSPEPTAVFVAAMADFAKQVVGNNSTTPTHSYEKYAKALRNELNEKELDYLSVISEFRSILGTTAQSPAKGWRDGVDGIDNIGSHASKRIADLFRTFLQAVSSPESPLVVLFDDLHWASEDSVDLIASLVSDVNSCNIFFVVTSCSGHPSDDDRLDRLEKQLHPSQVQVNRIKLQNLDESAVRQVVSSTLSLEDQQIVEKVSNVLFDRTHGNILFVRELLRTFRDDGLLRYDNDIMGWTCDIHMMSVSEEVNSVYDLLTARILELTEEEQETLTTASCLGPWIDDSLLTKTLSPRVPCHLKTAEAKGVLEFDLARGSFRFAHDAAQYAAYCLIPSSGREAFHVRIGRKLWNAVGEEELDRNAYTVLDQLTRGDNHFKNEKERKAVAMLCLSAAKTAVETSSFQKASVYLRYGIDSLGRPGWRDSYELNLRLHDAAVEVCYSTGQFKEIEVLVEAILKNARCARDALHARANYIYSLGSRGLSMGALKRALELLIEFNETFPSNPSTLHAVAAMYRTKRLLQQRSDEALQRLPPMESQDKLYVMQILNLMCLHALYAWPLLLPLLTNRMIKITLESGLSQMSCVGLSYYAMMLCRGGRQVTEGFRYGSIAMSVLKSHGSNADTWFGRVAPTYYGCICPWKLSHDQFLSPLKQAYRSSLASGDIEYAMLNWSLFCWNSIEMIPLPILEREVRALASRTIFFGQTGARSMIEPIWQFSLNLMGQAHGDPKVLTGEILNQDKAIAFGKLHGNEALLDWIGTYRAILSYWLGDYTAAESHTMGLAKIVSLGYGGVEMAHVLFMETLIVLSQARRGKRRRMTTARRQLRTLQKWALHSPKTMLGKQFLLEGEIAALEKKNLQAVSKYTSAIVHSREEGFLAQEALANERLGKFYVEQGDKTTASPYLHNACQLYEKWGGVIKLQQLREEISQIL